MAYSPSPNTTQTGSLAHLATVLYKKEGLDVLRQMNRFVAACEPDNLPARSGKTVQWYRYSTFAANVVPSAEGVVGNSLQLTTATVSATVNQYSDFITISTLLKATAIDDIMVNAARELGYRASITLDTLARNEFDANSGASVTMLGSSFTVADIMQCEAKLRALNVKPKDDGSMYGIIHPYITYDLMADPTAGGFIDLSKYTSNLSGGYPLSGEVGKVRGCRLVESTNVTTGGSAPNVTYRVYIVGKGAVGNVALDGYGGQNVEDPSNMSFKINSQVTSPSLADPEGNIGG